MIHPAAPLRPQAISILRIFVLATVCGAVGTLGMASPPADAPNVPRAAPASSEMEPVSTFGMVQPNSLTPRKATRAILEEPQTAKSPDAKKLIIEAHQIAERATTEALFAQIIELCDKASVTPLDQDIADYAHRLASWAHNRRGELRAEAGEDREAFADFDAAVRHDPTRWRAIHNRGVSYAHAGEFKESFDDFCRTIQLNAKHAKAYSNRGALYEQAGDFDASLDDYRNAIEIDPSLAVAHAGRGRINHQLGNLDVAHDELTEAIRLAPDNSTFYLARADLYAETWKYEAALVNYGKAIELNPLMAEAYRNGAWLLATCPVERFRDESNALEGAQKGVELAGEDRHLFLDTLAAAHANAGDFQSAVRTAELAVDEAPAAFRTYYAARLELYEQSKPYRTRRAGR